VGALGMSAASPPLPDEPAALDPAAAPEREDRTGRDRITHNVLASWGGYLFEVVVGFVTPRLMDRHLGQVELGIWDFAWSVVAYFRLGQIGIAGSVTRYVARYRAANDAQAVRRVTSSALVMDIAIASAVLAMTALATWWVPWLLRSDLVGEFHSARWVVALLGVSLAVRFITEVFQNVITGSHRWDLHNGINAVSQLTLGVGMVGALLLGGGLRSVAAVHLVNTALTELLPRMIMAYRVCPELRLRWAYADWKTAKEVIAYGLKFSVSGMSRVSLFQTNNLLVAAHMGPGALALFMRPFALMRVVDSLVSKFALVLSPTASSLKGSGRQEELRELVIKGTRFGTALVLPMTLVLSILGGPILTLWMGARYDQGLVLAIVVWGLFLSHSQRAVMSILAGLNLHGRTAMSNVYAAVIGISLSCLNIYVFGWGLPGAALAIAFPITITTALMIPAYACRRLGVPFGRYLRESYIVPFACALPLAAVLIAARVLFAGRPLLALIVGCSVGGLVTVPLYLKFLLPDQLRRMLHDVVATRVLGRFGQVRPGAARP
jgi:O-antigen/teichoic acid export membrane protein